MYIIIITNKDSRAYLLKEYLSAYGLEVTLFFKPMSAVEAIKKQIVDCVLLDFAVKEIDCFQLCQLISKLSKSPILMFGGSQNVEHECRAFDVGCVEYIRDPYVLDVFVRRLKHV